MPKTPADILRDAKKLIERPETWCKYANYNHHLDGRIERNYYRAIADSDGGGPPGRLSEAAGIALECLDEIARRHGVPHMVDLELAETTTHDRMMEVMDVAIQMAEQRAG